MDASDDAVEEELIKHVLIFSKKKKKKKIKHMLIYQKCGLQGSNEGKVKGQ